MANSSSSPEAVVREIKRKTRRVFNAEEKIRIVLEGLHTSQYYKWSKEFLEAGKKRLAGDEVREATAPEVGELRQENDSLKQLVAELCLKNRVLKKSLLGLE